MIPEAAVEAAHARVQFHLNMPDFPDDEVQATLRLALEAAAPHMLAEAWDEGSIAGWVESGRPHTPTPSRTPRKKQRNG